MNPEFLKKGDVVLFGGKVRRTVLSTYICNDIKVVRWVESSHATYSSEFYWEIAELDKSSFRQLPELNLLKKIKDQFNSDVCYVSSDYYTNTESSNLSPEKALALLEQDVKSLKEYLE